MRVSGHHSHTQERRRSVRPGRSRVCIVTEVIVSTATRMRKTRNRRQKGGARYQEAAAVGGRVLTGLATANSPDIVVFLDGTKRQGPSEAYLSAPIIPRACGMIASSGSPRRAPFSSSAIGPWHSGMGQRHGRGLDVRFYTVVRYPISALFAPDRQTTSRARLKKNTYGWDG